MVLKAKVNSAAKTPVNWKNGNECQLLTVLTLPMFRNGGDQNPTGTLIQTMKCTSQHIYAQACIYACLLLT